MSRIHIARDRQTLGQFSPEEVAEGLRSGRFLPTDLAWREGMSTWEPLSTFADLPTASEVPTFDAPNPFLAPGDGILETASPAAPTPAWEEEKSLFSRLVETIQGVLLSPAEAFSNVPANNGILRALGFMILVGWPAAAVSLGYQVVAEFVQANGGQTVNGPGPAVMAMVAGVLVLFVPVLLVVGTFLSSAIFHGILMMLGAVSRSYWTTFRVVAYVNGATMVLLLVPVCGSIAQGLWAFFSLAVGLKTVHGTTWTNTIVTLLLPTVICCGIIVAIVSLGYAQSFQ